MNFVTLKMGVALHLSLQFANHKSQRSYFGVERFLAISSSLAEFFYEKEGTTIFGKSCVSFAFKYTSFLAVTGNYHLVQWFLVITWVLL